MAGGVITTQRGCAYSFGSLILSGLMAPGGVWLLTGWGLFERRLDVAFAFGIVFVVAVMISWSLGWLHNRYVVLLRPPWVTHPMTRTVLACGFFTMVAAWPFGASSNDFDQFAGIPIAPAIGVVSGVVWFFIFGSRIGRGGPSGASDST